MVNRRVLLLAPLGVAVVAGAGFWTVLRRMKAGHFDPHDVPSQLIGRAPPAFEPLPPLGSGPGFGSADLAAAGRPLLVNFFASWCVPCVIEHPVLMQLAQDGLPVWGVAYKDKPDAAAGFIERRGNPFARVAQDVPGRVAIEWGVYGVPESYLLDRQGVVRWRMAGPVTPSILAEQLRPLLRSLA